MNLRKSIFLGMLSVFSLAFLTSVNAQTINFTGDTWAYEAGCLLTFNGDTILDAPVGALFPTGNTQPFNISSYGAGDYVLTLLDDYGDGGTSFAVDAAPLNCAGDCSGTGSGTSVDFMFTLTSDTPGCTDMTAINYDMEATLDDGSCLFNICSAGETMVFFNMTDSWGDGWNGNVYEIYNEAGDLLATGNLDASITGTGGSGGGPNAGQDTICLADGSCLSVFVGGGGFPTEVGWTISDVITGASLAGAVGGGIYDFYFGTDVQTCGCTDDTALNFDGDATADDGSCVFPSCPEGQALVQFMMYDTFGDGWDGTTYTLYDGDGNTVTSGAIDNAQFVLDEGAQAYDFFCLSTTSCYTLTLAGGSYPGEKEWQIIDYITGDVLYDFTNGDGFGTFGVSGPGVQCGCTNSSAYNFDADASADDGTCFAPDCEGNADSTSYMLHLTHDIYLYWGNNSAYIYDLNTGDTLLAAGLDPSDNSYTPEYAEDVVSSFWQFCVPNDACLALSAGGGSPAGLPNWEIMEFNGTVVHSGSLGVYDIGFGADAATCVSGCTLAAAINYNADATIDDGSCVVCDAGQLGLTVGLQDDFGNGWYSGNGGYFFVSEATGDTVLTGTMEAGSTYVENIACVEVGCYTFSTTELFTTEGWSLSDNLGNEYAALTYGPTEGYPVAFGGTDATDCGFTGCTDATAVNYNLSASVDDASCVYAPGNDLQENAQAIACGLTLPGTLEWASGDEYNGTTVLGNPISNNGAIWYEFNAGSDQQVTFNLCASEDADNGVTDTDIIAFVQNTDGSLTAIATNDDNPACNAAYNSILTINAEQGSNYFLRVGTWSSTTTQTGIVVSVTCADCPDGFPSNDDLCTLALPLVDGGDYSGSLCCTGPDDDFGLGSLSIYATAYGVWYELAQVDPFNMYSVTIDATGLGAIGYGVYTLGDDCTDLNDTQGGVIQGSLQSEMNGWFATEVAGPVQVDIPVSAGGTYYLYLWTTQPADCGTYALSAVGEVLGCTDATASNYNDAATVNDGCVYIGVTQANDSCSNAIAVACGSTTAGNTGGSTIAGAADPCGTAGAGVWYNFDNANTEQLVTISTCGSTVNTEFELYQSVDAADVTLEVNSLSTTNYGNISAVIEYNGVVVATIPAGDLFATLFNDFYYALSGGDYTVTFTNEGTENDGLTATVIDSYGNLNTLMCSGGCSTAPTVCMTLSMDMDNYSGETSWDVVDANGNVVASGDNYGGNNNATVTADFCVAAGSYTLNMYDSFGDGGPDYTLTTADGDELVNTFLGGSVQSDNFSVDASPYNLPGGGTLTQSFSIFGGSGFCSSLLCIDEVNNTVIGTESCDNGQTTQVVMGAGTSNVGILVSAGVGSLGGPFDLVISCEPAVYGCMDALACNYDATANVATDCDFLSCVDCISESWSYCYDSNEEWSFVLTNPDATGNIVMVMNNGIEQNWDDLIIHDGPNATDPVLYNADIDGADTENYIVISSGAEMLVTFDSDASVSCVSGTDDGLGINLEIYCAPAPSVDCADSTACNFTMAPDFADNTMCDFSCLGCTDGDAINTDIFATIDDGSCCYGEAQVTINMFDSFGDGWNGNTYELYLDDVLVASGTVASGDFASDEICLDAVGCYSMTVGGGSFASEVSWSITGGSNGDLAGGTGSFMMGLGADCTSGCTVLCAANYEDPAAVDISDETLCDFDLTAGCTYETADNYDLALGANYDDGSCTFSLSNPCPTDLNDDGATTTSDLLIFLGAFGTDCE